MSNEDTQEDDDAALLGRIGRGDQAALEAFYYRYEARIYRFVRARLNDPAAAADILNDAMLEVWRNAMKFGGRSRVSTWVLGIAHHKLIDHMRREGRHGHEELDPAEPDRDTPSVTEAIAGLQDADRLQRCIETLSAAQRETVHLAFFEELPYGEIAAITDTPEGTVKTRIYHAKQALKRCLGAGATT